MKNVKLIGEIAREATKELTKGTKESIRLIAETIVRKLQPAIEEETGVVVDDKQEAFMADLLTEQFDKVYEAYANKDRISEKRLEEAKQTIRVNASAIYTGDCVEGETALERGNKYSLDVLSRSEMDSFRDRRNETACKVASMIRSITDPELYYYIESMLPTAIENVINAAKAHLASQEEVEESMASIASSLAESIEKDKVIQLIAQNE